MVTLAPAVALADRSVQEVVLANSPERALLVVRCDNTGSVPDVSTFLLSPTEDGEAWFTHDRFPDPIEPTDGVARQVFPDSVLSELIAAHLAWISTHPGIEAIPTKAELKRGLREYARALAEAGTRLGYLRLQSARPAKTARPQG